MRKGKRTIQEKGATENLQPGELNATRERGIASYIVSLLAIPVIEEFHPTDQALRAIILYKQKRMKPHSTRLGKEFCAGVIINISIPVTLLMLPSAEVVM